MKYFFYRISELMLPIFYDSINNIYINLLNLSLTHFSLETPNRVTGKQCNPRPVASEVGVWSGASLFANI